MGKYLENNECNVALEKRGALYSSVHVAFGKNLKELLLHILFFEILYLPHDLLKYDRAVLRRITVFNQADFYVLLQSVTDTLIVKPVRKCGVGVNDLLYFFCKGFALVIAIFPICTILKVVFITQMDQYIIKGFFFKGQSRQTYDFSGVEQEYCIVL